MLCYTLDSLPPVKISVSASLRLHFLFSFFQVPGVKYCIGDGGGEWLCFVISMFSFTGVVFPYSSFA